jgi:hypothetical protein
MSFIIGNYNKDKDRPEISKDGFIQSYPPHNNSLPTNFEANDYRKYIALKDIGEITAWEDENGNLTHYTERAYKKNGEKYLLPYTYETKLLEDGKTVGRWSTKGWRGNKYFHKSQEIKSTNKPVLIVEGEKCMHFAEKNKTIQENYIVTTWYGGTSNIYDFNFNVFADKEVILCPDNDPVGKEAMYLIAHNLMSNKITDRINYLSFADKFPGEFKSGWDIADTFPNNYSLDEVIRPGSIFVSPFSKVVDTELLKKVEEKILKRQEKEAASKISDSYCYCMANDMFIEQGSIDFLTSSQINNFYKHINRNLSKDLLENPNFKKAKTFFTNAKYPPGIVNLKPGEIPLMEAGPILNIHKPNLIKAKPGDINFILNFYKDLFGSKWDVIEKWIAYLVQHPGEKIKWALCIVSEIEGTGKGLLARIISKIKGHYNVNENANFKHLINNHNTLLVGKEVIVLNEISLGDFKSKAEGSNSLKNFIADDFYTCNFKNKPMVVLPNLTNFILFSNDPRVIAANAGGRRYHFSRINISEDEIIEITDSGFFDRAWNFVESDEGAASLLHYFKHEVKIEDPQMFKRRAPQTTDLQDLIEETKHPVIKKLEYELHHNHRSFFAKADFSGLMSFDELNKAMSTKHDSIWFDNIDWGSYGDDALLKFLAANGKEWNNREKTKQINVNGKWVRYYILKDEYCPIPNKSYADLTPKQLSNIIQNYKNIKSEIQNEKANVEKAKARIANPRPSDHLFDQEQKYICQKIAERGPRTEIEIVEEFNADHFRKVNAALGTKQDIF